MKRDWLGSGVLAVFRLFIVIRLFFVIFSIILQTFSPFSRLLPYSLSLFVALGETIFLLVYLSWPWLSHKLGRAYLPLALGIATIGPIVEHLLVVALLPGLLQAQPALSPALISDVTQVIILGGQFQLVILLLVPLILVSWEYPFRIVAMYCAGLAALDLTATFFIAGRLPGSMGRMLAVVIFFILLYLFLGYIITRLVAEQRQQTGALAQANRRLASYASTLEQLTISRERNRLAREFHDTLAHTLSALAVQLEAVSALWENNPEKAHSMLAQSLTMTRDGLNETRRAIKSLRARPLEDMGLSLAIESLACSLIERDGQKLNLHLTHDLPVLNPDVEHGIYRIAEEALRNVAQHAKAKNVDVALERRRDWLLLSIRDDGSGFSLDPDELENHYGLRGMQERAVDIGGTLTIDGQPGAGTIIRLNVEVNDDPSAHM
jgi:signal transduction histidine kinase